VLGGGIYFYDPVEGDFDLEKNFKKEEIQFCVGPNPNPPNEDDLNYLFGNKEGKDCEGWAADKSEIRCEKRDNKKGNQPVFKFTFRILTFVIVATCDWTKF